MESIRRNITHSMNYPDANSTQMNYPETYQNVTIERGNL